jgi:hypothetical protein
MTSKELGVDVLIYSEVWSKHCRLVSPKSTAASSSPFLCQLRRLECLGCMQVMARKEMKCAGSRVMKFLYSHNLLPLCMVHSTTRSPSWAHDAQAVPSECLNSSRLVQRNTPDTFMFTKTLLDLRIKLWTFSFSSPTSSTPEPPRPRHSSSSSSQKLQPPLLLDPHPSSSSS